jgi:PleD family two-component response regulator
MENTILIIDDNPDTIRLLSAMLRGQARVLFATNGMSSLLAVADRALYAAKHAGRNRARLGAIATVAASACASAPTPC